MKYVSARRGSAGDKNERKTDNEPKKLIFIHKITNAL